MFSSTVLFTSIIIALSTSQRFLTKQEKQDLLDIHNKYRRYAVKKNHASNMRLMQWDLHLEKFAYDSVGTCKTAHTKGRGKLGPGGAGENLAWTSEQFIKDIPGAVTLWHGERPSYIYETGCKPRHKCGHYTQIIWSRSYMLGCATTSKQQCKGRSLMFCNYAPAGNIVGYKPYKIGRPCSDCNEDWKYCIDGLCSMTKEPVKIPDETIASLMDSGNRVSLRVAEMSLLMIMCHLALI